MAIKALDINTGTYLIVFIELSTLFHPNINLTSVMFIGNKLSAHLRIPCVVIDLRFLDDNNGAKLSAFVYSYHLSPQHSKWMYNHFIRISAFFLGIAMIVEVVIGKILLAIRHTLTYMQKYVNRKKTEYWQETFRIKKKQRRGMT